jgi:hypothetical protein
MLKVIYNGDFLCNIYPHATKWQVFKYRLALLTRRTLMAVFALGMLYGAFFTGRVTTSPVKVFADKEVIVQVKSKSPVMDRIAVCESGGHHIEKATGQVIMRSNTNKTVDVGKYQINSVWFKKASELGLDITKEKDNEEFAYWLYENRGTNDWYSSKSCWSK